MATEVLKVTDTAGLNIYFVVWNDAGQVFDFSDNSFKALSAPPTTPYVAATEKTDLGGVGISSYRANLNLVNVNPLPSVMVLTIEAYRRAGGSPAITTDVCIGDGELRVAAGSVVAEGSPGDVTSGYVVKVGGNVESTTGDYLQLYAWIELHGQPVVIAGGCVFAAYANGSTVAQWTESSVANNAIGQFECRKHLPNLTDDNKYLFRATITTTSGSVVLVGQDAIPAIGGV